VGLGGRGLLWQGKAPGLGREGSHSRRGGSLSWAIHDGGRLKNHSRFPG